MLDASSLNRKPWGREGQGRFLCSIPPMFTKLAVNISKEPAVIMRLKKTRDLHEEVKDRI